MTLLLRILCSAFLCLFTITLHADELTDLAGSSVESSFSTASLLSDKSVVKLGFFNFNPNEVIDTGDDNLGSDDATSLRSGIKQFNLPLEHEFDGKWEGWRVGGRISYIDVEQKVLLGTSENQNLDELSDRVLSFSAGGGYTHKLSQKWSVKTDLHLAWMKYQNRIVYNSDISNEIKSIFEGLFVNYDAEMLMTEPTVEVNYQWQTKTADFETFVSYHYLYGIPLNVDNPAHDVHPNEWYITTGLRVFQPVQLFGVGKQKIKYRLSRIDVSNQLATQMTAGHYYELELGWLKALDQSSYINEIGVGLNLNYGSVLKGGTLLIYYKFN